MAAHKPGRGPPQAEISRHLGLVLPASTTVRNKCLLCKLPTQPTLGPPALTGSFSCVRVKPSLLLVLPLSQMPNYLKPHFKKVNVVPLLAALN